MAWIEAGLKTLISQHVSEEESVDSKESEMTNDKHEATNAETINDE